MIPGSYLAVNMCVIYLDDSSVMLVTFIPSHFDEKTMPIRDCLGFKFNLIFEISKSVGFKN